MTSLSAKKTVLQRSLPMAITPESLRFILGLKLRQARLARGESLAEVAQRSGVSVSYLSEIEKGKKYPKAERLLRLAQALEVPFDDLVSSRVDEELGPLETLASSPLLREFPFELFGVEPQSLLGLATEAPEKAGALVRALLDVGRTYGLHIENFLLAALRSYQQMNANYFPDLEAAAAEQRRRRGWEDGRAIAAAELARLLEQEHGYAIDTTTLAGHPLLHGFRSVYSERDRPTLYVNGRLLPAQQAFVLARELGYRELALEERAMTSSWIEVESFDQVLNNFRASYFAGALLIDRDALGARLRDLFSRRQWQPQALLDCLDRFVATPEMFLHRLTELVPELFGLREIFFVRFHRRHEARRFRLTKVFNLSRVAVPHGASPSEHYCRRWPGLTLLDEMADAAAAHPENEPPPASETAPRVRAQRSRFVDEGEEFFVISMARPLVLSDRDFSAVSIGFLVDETFRRTVRFWDDPSIPRLDVSLTCERCPLTPEECAQRAAPAEIREGEERRRRQAAALEEL